MRRWRLIGTTAASLLAALGVLVAEIASGGPAVSAQTDALATASLMKQDGIVVGVAVFTQQGGSVRIAAEVNGLPPGFHGFHVHAVGICDAATQFMSAGGHVNPGGVTHSDHAGDLPSLYVNADGTGSMSFTTDRFSVASLFDGDGSALMIHADKDNFGHIPARYGVAPDETTLNTGDAGARIACGMIDTATPRS